MNRIRKMPHGEIALAGHPATREDVDCDHCLPSSDLGGANPALPGASS